MDFQQIIQITVSILIPFILWLVNKSYEEGKSGRAEILNLLKETRIRQDKIEERLYKLELEFEIIDSHPTHMKKPNS